MTASIDDKVIAIIAQQAVLDRSEVSPGMTLDELGIDSLGRVEAIFAIEETFDISVPFNANDAVQSAFDISSVGSIIAAVKDLIEQQK